MKTRKSKIGIGVLILVLLAVAFLPGPIDAIAKSLKCKQVVSDPNAGAFRISCRGATIYYDAGTCSGKCAGNNSLPIDAGDALDALWLTPASFIYVRMIDENKVPIDRWVTVCFDANTIDDVRNPRIRYFVPSTKSWILTYHRFDPDTGAMCTDYKGEFSMVVLGVAK